jgi:uncharacterized RDD family membrane protein YckC
VIALVPPAAYVTPDGTHVGTYAVFWRRAAAGAVDWTLASVLFLLGSIVGGLVDLIPSESLVWVGDVVGVIPPLVYFAFYLHTGSTLGMRAADIQFVVAATGRPPGWIRSTLRAAVAIVLATAVYVVYAANFAEQEPLGGYSHTEDVTISVSTGLVAAAAVAKLWAVVDRRRQTLIDKPFGLVFVENVAPLEPDRSPWGGLWQRGGS